MFWIFSVALAEPPTILRFDVDSGRRVEDRVALPAGEDLVLLYTGEHAGNAGPCGCSLAPRGGMATTNAIIQAAKTTHRSLLTVHAGQALRSDPIQRGTQNPATEKDNAQMVSLLSPDRWDAVNVGWSEIGSVNTIGQNWVSANLRQGDAYPSVRWFDRGQLRVAVTGVSNDGSRQLWSDDVSYTEPVQALHQLMPSLAEADVVIVLASGINDIQPIADLDGVDVIIDANRHVGRWNAQVVGDAIWARSPDKGERIGDLRLWTTNDGFRVVKDGQIVMDDNIRLTGFYRKLAAELAK